MKKQRNFVSFYPMLSLLFVPSSYHFYYGVKLFFPLERENGMHSTTKILNFNIVTSHLINKSN